MSELKRKRLSSKKYSDLELLAEKFYIANKEMNQAKAKMDKARKTLYSQMKESKTSNFSFNKVINQKDISLEVSIGRKRKDVVDTEKLFSLVELKTFVSMVSATKKSIIDKVGTEVANQVTVEGYTSENVSIKESSL